MSHAGQPAPGPPNMPNIQRILDENAALIKTISEYQNVGKHSETVMYQMNLHKNLMDLAKIRVVEEMAAPAEEPIQDATEKNATPSWQAGMFCRGIFKDDGLVYEGVIKSIESTEDGQYAVVEFIGYGNQECIWLQDLLNSNGEKARQKQNKEAIGEAVVNGQDVPDAKITGVVETMATPSIYLGLSHESHGNKVTYFVNPC